MIRLHQYPAAAGLPSLSPFCVKVEWFLRQHGIPYESVTEWNPRRGPKGKMPFIEHGGEIIADSTFIVDYLRRKFGIEEDLSVEERAIAGAFQRLIEENLYWVILYARWGDPAGWRYVRGEFASFFPWGTGPVVLCLIRWSLLRQLRAQGIGRHRPDEIYAIGERDLRCLSDFLGDKKFLLGDRWTSVDATASAFLSFIARMPYENPLRASLRARPNLVRYASFVVSPPSG